MLKVKREGILLEKTKNGFENEAVFNPAAIRDGDFVHLYYRAVRIGNYSSIGYCKLKGPLDVIIRKKKPLLFPEPNRKYESQGIEDPRICKIDNTCYLTYSAYDKVNVFGDYAISTDYIKFTKQKTITPKFTYREYKHFIETCSNLNEKYFFHYTIFKEHGLGEELAQKLYVWDKNLMFFPRKINGKFAFLHRIHPGIQIVLFNDFDELTVDFWNEYLLHLDEHIVMDPKLAHESSHIGGGCPPIETTDGWLLIYHAAEATPDGFIYHAAAALLDLNDPSKEISRLAEPLISPSQKWVKEGIVKNIIFPTGAVQFDNLLYIYYGAADTCIGTASLNINKLIQELKKNKNRNHV